MFIRIPSAIGQLSSTTLYEVVRRSSSSDDDCSGSSSECQKPVSTQGLAIGLGVGIPVLLAACGLAYFHFKNVRKQRREDDELDKEIDVDMDDYDDTNSGLPHVRYSTYAPPAFINGDDASSLHKSSSDGRENPFHGGNSYAPYLDHDYGSKTSLEEYMKNVNSMGADSAVYSGNASIYSGSAVSLNSPRYPAFPRSQSSNSFRDTDQGSMFSRSHTPQLAGSRQEFPLHRNSARITTTRPNSALSSATSYTSCPAQNSHTVSPPSSGGLSDVAVSREKAKLDTSGDDFNSPSSIPNESFSFEDSHEQTMTTIDSTTHLTNNRLERHSHHPNTDLDIYETDQKENLHRTPSWQSEMSFVSSHHELSAIVPEKEDLHEPSEHVNRDSNERLDVGSLGRNDTKHFDRVKSIYREYMPESESVESSPEIKPQLPSIEPEELPRDEDNQQSLKNTLPLHAISETIEKEHNTGLENNQIHEASENDNDRHYDVEMTNDDHENRYNNDRISNEVLDDGYDRVQQMRQSDLSFYEDAPLDDISSSQQHDNIEDDKVRPLNIDRHNGYDHDAGSSHLPQYDYSDSVVSDALQKGSQSTANHMSRPQEHQYWQHDYQAQQPQSPRVQNSHANYFSSVPSPSAYHEPSYHTDEYYANNNEGHRLPSDQFSSRNTSSPSSFIAPSPRLGNHSGRVSQSQSPVPSSSPQLPQIVSPLPSAHSMGDFDSPLAYAPQKRHKLASDLSLPESPGYNYNNGSGLSSPVERVADSPHAMRQSVILTSDFIAPKKRTGGTGSTLGFTHEVRPYSQLVPDSQSELNVLRPSMNMR